MIETIENDNTAKTNPIIVVHLIVVSSFVGLSNIGKRTKNEIIMNKKPISSNTINIP
jgi:hypothetical protein